MKQLSTSHENEMVLAFLKAEIDSPRFGAIYEGILVRSGLTREEIVDYPDLGNPRQNSLRKELLKLVRGYGANQLLFRGFPQDVSWSRHEIQIKDLDLCRYANFPTWIKLSGGTRRVIDGAANIDLIQVPEENANQNIKAVAEALKAGKRYPELIAAQANNGPLTLLEGHTRATAYLIANFTEPIIMIVGTSQRMSDWAFY